MKRFSKQKSDKSKRAVIGNFSLTVLVKGHQIHIFSYLINPHIIFTKFGTSDIAPWVLTTRRLYCLCNLFNFNFFQKLKSLSNKISNQFSDIIFMAFTVHGYRSTVHIKVFNLPQKIHLWGGGRLQYIYQSVGTRYTFYTCSRVVW